jgi:hypothetical protein
MRVAEAQLEKLKLKEGRGKRKTFNFSFIVQKDER